MPWSFKVIKGSREACIGPRGSHSRPSYAGSITGFVFFLATFTANDVDLTKNGTREGKDVIRDT